MVSQNLEPSFFEPAIQGGRMEWDKNKTKQVGRQSYLLAKVQRHSLGSPKALKVPAVIVRESQPQGFQDPLYVHG